MSKFLQDETIDPCVICGKVWKRGDAGRWLYHDSKGVVCSDHPGVLDWYAELMSDARWELIEEGVLPESMALSKEAARGEIDEMVAGYPEFEQNGGAVGQAKVKVTTAEEIELERAFCGRRTDGL